MTWNSYENNNTIVIAEFDSTIGTNNRTNNNQIYEPLTSSNSSYYQAGTSINSTQDLVYNIPNNNNNNYQGEYKFESYPLLQPPEQRQQHHSLTDDLPINNPPAVLPSAPMLPYELTSNKSNR